MAGVIVAYSGAKGINAITLVRNALAKKPLNIPSGWPGIDDAITVVVSFEVLKGLGSAASSFLRGLIPAASPGGGGNEAPPTSTPETPPPPTPGPPAEPTPPDVIPPA